MTVNPYKSLESHAYWRRSVSAVNPHDVDPVVRASFSIGRADRVATGGSCFAQHIARHLRDNGFNYYVAEQAHPIASPELAREFNYGVFSARYGNVYTSRNCCNYSSASAANSNLTMIYGKTTTAPSSTHSGRKFSRAVFTHGPSTMPIAVSILRGCAKCSKSWTSSSSRSG